MECPKCGRVVEAGAFICPGCEFILDTSFLGEDITDDERDKRLGKQRRGQRLASGVDFGEDAVILGNGQGDYSDFSARDTGMTREVTQARFYIGGATAALLQDDAVPEIVPGVVETSLKMSPFERHVVSFINGKRSIGRLRKKSGMEETEFKTSVAMLADKGIIRLRTRKKKKKGGSLVSGTGAPEGRSEHGSGRSGASPSAQPAPAGSAAGSSPERTVLAPYGAAEGGGSSGSGPKGPIAAAAGLDDGRAAKPSVSPGFSSMRIPADAEGDEARTAGDSWSDANNISNVFARATASGRHLVPPPADEAPPPPDVPPADDLVAPGEDSGFFDASPTGERKPAGRSTAPEEEIASFAGGDELPEALRDPTGMGELRPVELRGGGAVISEPPQGGAGDDQPAAYDPAAYEDEDEEALPPPPPTAALGEQETAAPSDDELFSDEDDDDLDGSTMQPEVPAAVRPRPLSDEPTGPLSSEGRGGDARAAPFDDEEGGEDPGAGFDVELDTAHLNRLSVSATASLPQVRSRTGGSIPELPSDALEALPSQVSRPPAPAPEPWRPPEPKAPPPLPGAALVARPAATPARPAADDVPPPLPGQGAPQGAPAAPPAAPAPPVRPPTVMRGGLPTMRPAAQSTVPFEQARKAEKIFEQALKDHAEGRISSARMNAKLAAMYDPSVDTYRDFCTELDAQGANAKPPGGGKPRELVLFEQAAEAEGKGQFDKAVKLLQEAVALNPKAAALRNRLGVVLSIRLKEHGDALEQLRMAIELEPGNIVYMNNFSKVTALLDSQLDKGPADSRGRGDRQAKVEIKKMRPKLF
jgi:hypothetical protein